MTPFLRELTEEGKFIVTSCRKVLWVHTANFSLSVLEEILAR
jgi:Zn-finger protein